MRSLREKFSSRKWSYSYGVHGRSFVNIWTGKRRRGTRSPNWGKNRVTKNVCFFQPAEWRIFINSLCFEFRSQTSTVSTFSPLGPFPLRWSSANFYLHALPTVPACQCGAREVLSEKAEQENMTKAFLCSSSRARSHAGACTAAGEGAWVEPRSPGPGCYQDATQKSQGLRKVWLLAVRTKQEVSGWV